MTYSVVSDHRYMLFDDVRNSKYRRAIEALVDSDSVVLDLGAGVGLLGLIAAQAGAKHVYLVDPAPVVTTALRSAQDNGVADRVTVLEGKIEELELPQKVDVIISVMTGNMLFCEDLLASLYHARDKYLKPGGKLIPERARLNFRLVESEALYEKTVKAWDNPSQGVDFSSLQRLAANEIEWPHPIPEHKSLSEDVCAVELDLMTSSQTECDVSHEVTIAKNGCCHGILLWLSIDLHGYWLETLPEKNQTHWSPGYFPFLDPLEFDAGSVVKIRLRRPSNGEWGWQLISGKEFRTHSTFIANLHTAALLRKSRRTAGSGLNEKGLMKLRVLNLFQQGKSNEQVSELLAEEFASFATVKQASEYVQMQAIAYSELAADGQ